MVSTAIECKVAHMQVEYAPVEATATETNVSVARVERVQQMAEEFAASTREAQKLLTDLCVKIVTPAEWLRMSHDDCVGGLLGSRGLA